MVIVLWMDGTAEEAALFYTSIFKNSSMGDISYYPVKTPSNKEVGDVCTVDFTLNGQRFQCLNGGPMFKHSEAVSFAVECEDQDEIDYYSEKLAAVPDQEICGWVKDKYGVSWQIWPKNLKELIFDQEPEKYKKAFEAMMHMKRLNIAELEAAVNR